MFKANRNFAILERRKYGINVRILEVEDNDKLLSIVGRTNYEPLCRSFKIKTNEDIVKYINYIKSLPKEKKFIKVQQIKISY